MSVMSLVVGDGSRQWAVASSVPVCLRRRMQFVVRPESFSDLRKKFVLLDTLK